MKVTLMSSNTPVGKRFGDRHPVIFWALIVVIAIACWLGMIQQLEVRFDANPLISAIVSAVLIVGFIIRLIRDDRKEKPKS